MTDERFEEIARTNWTNDPTAIGIIDELVGYCDRLRAELAAFMDGKPNKGCIDDMIYFLERSNFGLLPPDGCAGMIPEHIDAMNWLRRIAAKQEGVGK